MKRALVVVEPRKAIEQLIRVAGEFARGADAELLFFHVADEFETSSARNRMRELTGSDRNYRTGIEGAEQFAEDVAKTLLDEDIQYAVEGAFGEKSDRILSATDEHGCDHVFLTGRRRSPTGKAVFGDTAQQVLLNADVPVTLLME